MLNTIGTTAYQNNASLLTNNNGLVQQSIPVTNGSTQNSSLDSTASTGDGVQVSLSPAVDDARLRESLGLPPTGRLTRQNLTTQIQTDQAGVLKALQSKLTELNIDPNTDITLSQDAKGQIQVTGAGTNTAALTKSLNVDADFAKMFSRLAANSKFLNFAGQNADNGTTATLSDYLNNSDTADSSLTTLIKQYDSLKTSNSSLASLISLSNTSGKPFSFSNNPDQALAGGSSQTLSDYLNSNNTNSDLATFLQQDESVSSDQARTGGSTQTLSDYLNSDTATPILTSS